MRSLTRLLPRLLRDRLPRSTAATILILFLSSPLWARSGSGFSDGYMRNAEPGAASVAKVLALLLALAAPWLAEGIVSDLRLGGHGPILLTRPVPRAGFYLARWVAGLGAITAAAITTSSVLNLVWSLRIEGGNGLSLLGSAGAALVIWVWVGSAVLLLSAVLDRGEALLGALLVAIPVALTFAVPPGSRLAEAAETLPTRPMLGAARDLLAGRGPEGIGLSIVLGWGVAALWAGLAAATRRDMTVGD